MWNNTILFPRAQSASSDHFLFRFDFLDQSSFHQQDTHLRIKQVGLILINYKILMSDLIAEFAYQLRIEGFKARELAPKYTLRFFNDFEVAEELFFTTET